MATKELANAVRTALAGRPQRWLAEAIHVHESAVSRYLKGEVPIPLELVPKIEDAIGVSRGALLRAAGYVEGGQPRLAEALVLDASVPPKVRQAILLLVDFITDEAAAAG